MKRFKLFLVVCGLLPALSTQAEPIQYDDWTLVCDPQPCVLTQTATDNLLKITVSQRAQGLFALIAVPLGINLPAGLRTQVDANAERRHAFATCTVAGCFSAIPLTGTKLQAWQRGQVLNVTFQDGEGADVANVISLLGFTASLSGLVAAESVR